MKTSMTTLFEGPYVRVTSRFREKMEGDLLVCFTGIGHNLGGMNVQSEEFLGAGQQFGNAVFITDKTRSWGNRLNFDRIADVCVRLTGANIHLLGNSMGGFLAIVASNYLKAKTCTAFAPQFSVHPDIVPGEQRWKQFTSTIKNFKIRDLSDQFNASTMYNLLTASSNPDYIQTNLFPKKINIRHFSALEGGHDISAVIKKNGMLPQVLAACFAGDLRSELFEAAIKSNALQLS